MIVYRLTMEMMAMNKNILQAIRRKIQEIVPQGSSAILFGSQARGDARNDSDWDVLILLGKERVQLCDYDNYSYPLREMGWELGADINPILYTKTAWEQNSYTPFYKNVTKEGIVLL